MIFGRKAMGTVAYLGGLPAVLEAFVWSWGNLIAYNTEYLETEQYFVHYDRSIISEHARARNGLARSFMGEWLLQLDTDHIFEPDLLARMLRLFNGYNLDVLTAFYQTKSSPHIPVLYQWIDHGGTEELHPMARWPHEVQLLQVGSAGGGCLLVRRSVFDRISAELGERPFDRTQRYSEDHSFFVRCRRLGIKAYAAMQIACHHLSVQPVGLRAMDEEALPVSEEFSVEGMVR